MSFPLLVALGACTPEGRAPAPRAAERRAAALAPAVAVPESALSSALVQRFPAPGAQAVCADATLRLTFASPPRLSDAGQIRVFDADAPEAPVAVVDMAEPSIAENVAGRDFRLVRPVFVDGAVVSVALPRHELTGGRTYFVVIDDGVFVDEQGRSLGALTGPEAWRFTVGQLAPSDPARWVVAQDGSGDFCTVQGAVDHVPHGNARRIVIEIERGVHHEIVFIHEKPELTLRGRDRRRTIIRYPNNERLQNGQGSRFRSLVNVENSDGLIVENLTLWNSTPQDGSQAEALRVDGSHRVVLRHADFRSLQDTLQLSGQVYVHDCYVEGNVDYVWGKGTAYFERCELKAVGRAGYDVQARNEDRYGFVFVDSTLTADPGVSGHLLARIEADRFPASHVAYVDCKMGPHVAPEGWLIKSGKDTRRIRFWEYGSRDLEGQPLDVSRRHPVSRQLDAAQAARMRDKAHVFGGWAPSSGTP